MYKLEGSIVIAVAIAMVLAGQSLADRQIVIYHTADIHGAVYPHSAHWFTPNPTRKVGGFAALSRVLQDERRPYALLDSGDIFQGTPEGNLTKGSIVVAAMNRLGYDAMAIGNHEYDYGEENLTRLQRESRFPFLAANIVEAASQRPVSYAVPRMMLHVGGVRIGVLGIATHTTQTSTLPQNVKHLEFKNEVTAATQQAELLRADGADLIVALTHCGLGPQHARSRISGRQYAPSASDLKYRGDLAIARGAKVDIILGGHMHTGLDGGWRDPESGTWIFQSFERLESVHRIVVTVRDTPAGPRVSGINARLIDLWVDKIGRDPEMDNLLKSFSQDIDERMDQVLGTAPKTLTRTGLDSELGNWLTDRMRAKVQADVGIQNTHGIRADLAAGEIRIRNLYEVMPFDNTLVVVTVTGHQLEALLRNNLFQGKTGLQISGARVRYRYSSLDGVRDLQIFVGDRAIQLDRKYTVATNNYLSSGGSGGEELRGLPRRDTGIPLRQLFIEDVMKHKRVIPPRTGRILELP